MEIIEYLKSVTRETLLVSSCAAGIALASENPSGCFAREGASDAIFYSLPLSRIFEEEVCFRITSGRQPENVTQRAAVLVGSNCDMLELSANKKVRDRMSCFMVRDVSSPSFWAG
ncbi:MAG: hypothetical protein AAF517_11735 [Planctomycetota bacterium]